MKPILVVNPADDAIFGAFAQVLIDDGAATVWELEHRLRTVYPDAAVHARELAAEPFVIWYVYRHGHWVQSRPLAEQSGENTNDGERTRRPPLNGGIDPQGRGAGSGARGREARP